jgi:Flp pilus assembly protein TadB
MGHWKTTLRELSAEARLHRLARSLSRRNGTGIHPIALYGAFAAIAAIVFGTLSIRSF